jgi:hypothetical protein
MIYLCSKFRYLLGLPFASLIRMWLNPNYSPELLRISEGLLRLYYYAYSTFFPKIVRFLVCICFQNCPSGAPMRGSESVVVLFVEAAVMDAKFQNVPLNFNGCCSRVSSFVF